MCINVNMFDNKAYYKTTLIYSKHENCYMLNNRINFIKNKNNNQQRSMT